MAGSRNSNPTRPKKYQEINVKTKNGVTPSTSACKGTPNAIGRRVVPLNNGATSGSIVPSRSEYGIDELRPSHEQRTPDCKRHQVLEAFSAPDDLIGTPNYDQGCNSSSQYTKTGNKVVYGFFCFRRPFLRRCRLKYQHEDDRTNQECLAKFKGIFGQQEFSTLCIHIDHSFVFFGQKEKNLNGVAAKLLEMVFWLFVCLCLLLLVQMTSRPS